MLIQDRRRCRLPAATELRAQLSTAQLVKLTELERDGWSLRFVRQDANHAVVAARDNSHAVLHADGNLESALPIALRN